MEGIQTITHIPVPAGVNAYDMPIKCSSEASRSNGYIDSTKEQLKQTGNQLPQHIPGKKTFTPKILLNGSSCPKLTQNQKSDDY